jgi:hypothetical protein
VHAVKEGSEHIVEDSIPVFFLTCVHWFWLGTLGDEEHGRCEECRRTKRFVTKPERVKDTGGRGEATEGGRKRTRGRSWQSMQVTLSASLVTLSPALRIIIVWRAYIRVSACAIPFKAPACFVLVRSGTDLNGLKIKVVAYSGEQFPAVPASASSSPEFASGAVCMSLAHECVRTGSARSVSTPLSLFPRALRASPSSPHPLVQRLISSIDL